MIKKLIYLFLSLVFLAVAAVVALVTLVNPNDFKPLITQEVKKITGRDLVIEGDISWRFWPNVGLSIEKTSLSNPQGFAESNLIQFNKAQLSVAVLPILSKTIEVNVLSLYDARIFVQTLADGKSNLDGLVQQSETTEQNSSTSENTSPSETETTGNQTTSDWEIIVGQVEIKDASAVIRDDKTKTNNEISKLNLNIEKFAFGEWVPISFDIAGKQNTMNFDFNGKSEAMIAKVPEESKLRNLILNASVEDKAQQLKVDSLALKINQAGLGITSAITLGLKAQSQDIHINSKGQLNLLVNDKIDLFKITDVNLSTDLTGKSIPKEAMKVGVKANVSFDKNAQFLDASNLALLLNEMELAGKATVKLTEIPQVRFDFKSKDINLDSLLGVENAPASETTGSAPTEDKTQTATPAKKEPLSNVEPDLSALKTLDVAGKIVIDKFVASNIKVSNVITDLAINRGKVAINKFDANLYGGSVTTVASLDATKKLPQYKLTNKIKGVEIQPLLIDAADQKILAGKGNIDINITGSGLSPLSLRTGNKGSVILNLADGAIYGVNLLQMIREAKAVLKGQKANLENESKKTDFSSLYAKFDLAKGIASTQNMKFQAPALRVSNVGSTNLVDESMKFTVEASIVETSKGQTNQDLADLKGVTVPVDIAGTWTQPTYGLNLKKLITSNKILENKINKEKDKLKEKAEKEVNKLLGDKIPNEDVKKLTDGLFNKLFN